MKYHSLLAGLLATATTALSIIDRDQAVLGEGVGADRYLIELGPGNTRWITEDEKWALRRVSLAGSVSLDAFRICDVLSHVYLLISS